MSGPRSPKIFKIRPYSYDQSGNYNIRSIQFWLGDDLVTGDRRSSRPSTISTYYIGQYCAARRLTGLDRNLDSKV